MRFKKITVFIVLLSSVWLISLYAETILLKSGKTIVGKIVEKTDTYIKVDISGVAITYYFEDIESIDGRPIYIPKQAQSRNNFKTTQREPKEIYKEISEAVVGIYVKTLDGFEGGGSGFIIDRKGIILTNYHVIDFAKEITVRLKDGRTYPVSSIIYYDLTRDVCLLKIEADNLLILDWVILIPCR